MNAATQNAIKAYRAAVVRQMTLPVSEQWTLGAEIKALKAAAYVEMEASQVRR